MASWTKGQVTLLTKSYGKVPLRVIAEKLDRSEAAVGMYLAKHRDVFKHIDARKGRHGTTAKKVAKKSSKKTVKSSTKKVSKKTATPKTTAVAVNA